MPHRAELQAARVSLGDFVDGCLQGSASPTTPDEARALVARVLEDARHGLGLAGAVADGPEPELAAAHLVCVAERLARDLEALRRIGAPYL